MERLQKLIAQAGVASRRHAEEMILAGRIRVNDEVVTELGTQVDPERDTILVDNQPIEVERKAYYLLNKPRGYISDRDDTAQLKTALDLVPDGKRMFAAGRLDLTSEGLLLVTNDGELANRLTHPRYEHEKEYLALVFGVPEDKALERLELGISYENEWLRADRVERAGRHQQFGEAGRDETWLRIILHEGKKRQIRHMCAAVRHPVKRLVRVRIGPLKIGSLKPGESRKLSPDELAQLQKQAQLRAPRARGPVKKRAPAKLTARSAGELKATPPVHGAAKATIKAKRSQTSSHSRQARRNSPPSPRAANKGTRPPARPKKR